MCREIGTGLYEDLCVCIYEFNNQILSREICVYASLTVMFPV